MTYILALLLLLCSILPARAVDIVAGENFYGDVAQQIGGAEAHVTSILNRPDQDPHMFEATPSVARAIARAGIVVVSGIDYDPWMEKLLHASAASHRQVINVAALAGKHAGDNPHIWYDLTAMAGFATALTEALVAADPPHADAFQQRLAEFQQSLVPLRAQIDRLRARYAGSDVTATEPVLGYLLDAIGLNSRNSRFQRAVMNDTEPSATDVAAFQDDLRSHRVKLLVYNSQASDPIADRMAAIARGAGVPLVGATETEPAGKTYQVWISDTLTGIEQALSSTQAK
jgi:zinc/manganese transport system substrate-binding protein